MQDHMIEKELYSTCSSEIELSQEDQKFIGSLLSFHKEAKILKDALQLIEKISSRYMSLEEKEKLFSDSGLFAHVVIDDKKQVQLYDLFFIGSDEKSVKKSLKITDEALSLIWRVSRMLLEEGEYMWSHQILFLLLSLEPMLIEGWIAYGYVSQKIGSFHTALNAYMVARILSGGMKSEIDLMIADCYLDMHLLDDALVYLNKYTERDEGEKKFYQEFAVVEKKMNLFLRYR